MTLAAQDIVADCSLFSWGCYSSQQSCELRTSGDGMSRSWIPSWWAKASPGNHTSNPHLSHALHWQLIPKYVAITHPQHYCGVVFFLNKLLFGWWEKKTDGGWLVCETVTLYYQPTCWGPKQCTLNQVWWFNVLFVQGQKLIDGMCAHPWPDLSHCWHKCDWLLELFWDVAGWTCNCFIWQQGLYVKKGKRQCVWLMLQ